MKRHKHSLSHYRLLTADMGELVPIGLMEVLPGDTFQQATSALVRVSPMLAPVMHPVRVRIHHWFVPTRLVWTDFEKFITGGPDGLDTTTAPSITFTPAEGSLADYMGLPTGSLITVNAVPFRAYATIWNEYYRDQDLQTPLTVSKANGADSTTSTTLQNVCWEKDYFTTARPWTQKGAAVSLPLGTTAPLKSDGLSIQMRGGTDGVSFLKRSTAAADSPLVVQNTGTAGALMNFGASGFAPQGLYADLAGATAATIRDLRTAFAMQRFAENRAQYGSRYTEYLKFLGVRSADARLDRPEYLGGGRQTIQFSEVLQTGTDYNANTGVGQMKGHGMGALRSNRYRRFFEEHGYIISMMSIMPKTMYAQGLEKHWARWTNEQYFQQELQDIGQVEVLNKEVYAAHSTPNGVFGYQDRYDEYRRMESKVCGEFKSTLNHWHMARIFAGEPALNASFVSANPTKRVLASQSTDGLYIMVNHSVQARRPVKGR